MWFKRYLIFFWLFRCISCDKSLTIVLDTTRSMLEEVDTIKLNIPTAIDSTNKEISNYILVPFNDPDVRQPTIVQTPRELISSLNSVTAGGGSTCPENTLSAIEKALQISKPKSNIFVFTDAYSRDVHKLGSLENLCVATGSQVVIFLTGYCSPQLSPNATVQVYYDVARACSGALVFFDAATLRQAFKYMKEVINDEWTDITTYETFTEHKQLSFSVDTFTKTVLILVSGDYPRLDISPNTSKNTFERVLETRHTQVVRLRNPTIGNYSVVIRCRDQTSLVIYKKYELPVKFGFSTKLPRKMAETSRRPLPGRKNYILIDASQNKIKLEGIEVQMADEEEKKHLMIQDTGTEGIYLTDTFIGPNKAFRIWIKGYDTFTYQEIKGSSENIIPQQGTATDTRWTKPHSEILETTPVTVDFGTNATFTCKVTGYPAPNILWEDDEKNILPSENELLEIPSLYISYVNLENVTINSTIYCKAKNSEGEDSQSIDVYVHRPFTFEVIQTPTDQTIEYGSEGKLYCQVSAYPIAETKWSHNGSTIIPSDHVEIAPETNTLWIKNMTTENVGQYKCEVTNEANMRTFTATVSISGIEAPEVIVDKTNVTLKLGDWSYLECRINKGKPTPTITWGFKSENGFDFGSLPEGTEVDDGKLKIASAAPVHNGLYRCDAVNIEGQHSAVISVQLQYPPSIKNDETTAVTVKEEDEVALPCKVEASPEARVHWEIPHEVMLDSRHYTDQRHNHRFRALWKDSGKYKCIAENDIGTARKTVIVNVLVAPYIEAASQKTVVARTGANLVLKCNVLYGNPVPSTRWEYIAPDSTKKVLSRGISSRQLYLNNVSYATEGSYLCISDNGIGTDSINIYVKIQ